MCQVYRLNCLVTKRRQSFYRLSSFTFSCFLLAFISLLLVGVGVQADSVIIESYHFDSNNIRVGDLFHLVLRLNAKTDGDLVILPLDLSDNFDLEVVDKPIVLLNSTNSSAKIYQIQFPLQAFTTGQHKLPPIRIQLDQKQIETPRYIFEVRSIIENSDASGQIKDIKPPILPPIQIWPYVVIGIVVILGLIAIGFWLHCRRFDQPVETEEPPLPPHAIAYANLERIKASDWIETGQFKTYYTKLSLAIRRYLENRYQINMMELPTSDLVDCLREQKTPKLIRSQIQNFLERLDVVKFSELRPNKVEAHQLMTDARKIIGLLRPSLISKAID